MKQPTLKYRKIYRQEADKICADVAEFICHEGKVVDRQDRLFNIFGDAYERGYCGPLSYRQYKDTLRIEWINSKPLVCGDTLVNYAMEKGLIQYPADEELRTLDSTAHYWGLQFDQTRYLWDAWTFAWHKLKYRHRLFRWYPNDHIPTTHIEPTQDSRLPPSRRPWEY